MRPSVVELLLKSYRDSREPHRGNLVRPDLYSNQPLHQTTPVNYLLATGIEHGATPILWQVMSPGLETLYFDKFVRHLNQLPPTTQGRPGEPILQLNHSFGNNEVFNSGKSRGIGIRMTGFIHLDQAGVYQFKAMANDGISLSIDDQQGFADPRVHSDHFSPTGKFTATADKHYPLLIKYFQRKGTATLKLY